MKILSGMRPTGKLHLGNYFGALKKWLELQNAGNETFFAVVDWHSLTTDYADLSNLQTSINEVVMDWLACGLDPEKSVIFLQSDIKEHAELHLLLSMVTPLGWLQRVPTYKEQMQEMKGKDLSTYGFLGYPVLQAADIMLYQADAVPVGEDQLPHLELTREIIRRLNNLYGLTIPEPKSLLTPTPRIQGTDGRKMSKSYDNAIYLSDSPEQVEKAVMDMVTDPARARRKDPGNPDNCNLFPLHDIVSPEQTKQEVRTGCTTAGIGCVDCKKMLIPNLEKLLAPIRERRSELSSKNSLVDDILAEGSKKAQAKASETMEQVRVAMNLSRKMGGSNGTNS